MEFYTIQKNLLDIEEFKKIDSIQEKFETIKTFWQIKENLIQGTIKEIDSKNIVIDHIKSLDGKKILTNPFTGEILKISVSKNYHLNNVKNYDLNINDDIIFEPILKNTKLSKNRIFNIKKNTIIKISRIKDVYEELGINIDELNQLISSKILYSCNEELKKENQKLEEIAISIKTDNEEQSKYLKELDLRIEFLKKEEDRLNRLGILEEKPNNKVLKEKLNIEKDEYVEYIRKYLACSYKTNLYYNNETIETFYTALSTNQLIILSGSPGTGKTSLVEGFCDAVGANKKIISVQPNWTENQDLIGFYNPIDKKYISTPFLDFLVEAKNNQDELYVICLDEMNLAHVEYYFAEFLSKLESKDKILELYSEEIYIKNRLEIESQMKFIEKKYSINCKEDIFNIDDINIFEKYNNLKSKYENLLKYNCRLCIPDNIKFVGTINKDETTKNLSPKVVDRSFIMEVEKFSEETKQHMIENIDLYKKEYEKVLNLDATDFKVNKVEINETLLSKLKNISSVVNEDFNISLNNRFFNQVSEILGANILDSTNILDCIIITKIIPKINIYIESNDEEKIDRFEKIIEGNPKSMQLFEKMKLAWEDTEVLTFWR